jgi:DNA-binding CsgD family transcriptional regulator
LDKKKNYLKGEDMPKKWILKFRAARTLQDVHQLSSDLCHELGLDHFIHLACVPQASNRFANYILSNFSDRERNASAGHSEGVGLLHRALEDARPLVWSAMADLDLPVPATRLPLAGGDDVLLSDGGMLGIHGGDGGKVVLCFTVRDGRLQDRDIDRILCLLQVMSPYVYTCLTAPTADATLLLSERERECLKWMIQGKTSWEIGKILGITERTTDFHVGNILRKMDCRNRSQAIGKALLNGHAVRFPDDLLERVVCLDQTAGQSVRTRPEPPPKSR